MRTTIRIQESLFRETKKRAAETGKTFTALVEDALREALARRGPKRRPGKTKWTLVRGKGLQPGVDLDNSAALLDLMERSQ